MNLHTLQAALHPLQAAPMGAGWNTALAAFLAEPLREAAVLVGLVERESGWQVVFTRRTEHLRTHAGEVSFPGGAMEAQDRDAVATALRETREEIGIPAQSIRPLGFLDPLMTISGFRVMPVVAALAADYQAAPDPQEVAEVFELPLSFLLAPESLFHSSRQWRGQTLRIAELHPWPGHPARVWGATAMIVENLRNRLEAAR